MSDIYSKQETQLDDPYVNGFAITPNDSTDLAISTRAIWVGGTGAVKVTLVGMTDGTSITLSAVPVGLLKLRAKRVWTVGSPATNLVGLY